MSTNNQLLSIIVPVYNAGEFLRPCIQSILDNDYENFELLLICDEPTDDSFKVCQEYAKNDNRIKALLIPHGGVSVARNVGLFLASGEWIGFVDADDTIEPNRFSDAITAAKEHNVQMVSCAITKINNGKAYRVIKDRKAGIVPFGNETSILGLCTNHIYKADLINDNEIRFKDCDYGEDSIFSAQAFFYAGETYHLGVPLYYLTRGHESLSGRPITEERKQRLLEAANSAISDVKNRGGDYEKFAKVVTDYLMSRPFFREKLK